MNILIIDHYAGSADMGMEYRPYYYCKNWAKMGHITTILTADFSHLRINNPRVEKNFKTVYKDDIKYIFVKTNQYANNGYERFKNIAEFLFKSYFNVKKILEEITPDVVIASSTYPFDIIIARKIAKKTGAKIVFEVHDIWPLSLIELYGFSKYNPIILLTDYFEKSAYKKSDFVISVLSNAKQYFDEKNISQEKYLYFPNGIEIIDDLGQRIPTKHIELIKKFKADGKFIVMYCGGFSAANYLDYFVNTASAVEKDTVFIAVGNGPKKIYLRRYARKMEIENVYFLDGLERKQLFMVMDMADCLYFGAKESIIYEYGISMNKMYDYMLAGKPVICAIKAKNNPIENSGCALIVSPNDSLEVAKAIEEIKSMTVDERKLMGYKGREYVLKNHNYENLAKKYAEVLEELINGKKE
ncbi:MAG: glycosyltransferase family 4 protein [Oscillospiraceae bacterium]